MKKELKTEVETAIEIFNKEFYKDNVVFKDLTEIPTIINNYIEDFKRIRELGLKLEISERSIDEELKENIRKLIKKLLNNYIGKDKIESIKEIEEKIIEIKNWESEFEKNSEINKICDGCGKIIDEIVKKFELRELLNAENWSYITSEEIEKAGDRLIELGYKKEGIKLYRIWEFRGGMKKDYEYRMKKFEEVGDKEGVEIMRKLRDFRIE